jgi:hypothetical protein
MHDEPNIPSNRGMVGAFSYRSGRITIEEVFDRLDFVTLGLQTAGLTLLCTVLAQGWIFWWTTERLG